MVLERPMSLLLGVFEGLVPKHGRGVLLRSGAVVLVAVAIVLSGSHAGAFAHSAESDAFKVSVPGLVVESIEPGGRAYEQAVSLRAAEWQQGQPSGPVQLANIAQAVASPLVFGRVYPLVRLQVSDDGSGTLGASDLANDNQRFVAFDAGQARGPLALTVSEAGEMIEFGTWDDEQVNLLESLPEGGFIATLAMPLEGTFWIDGGGNRVVALDSSAEELVRGREINAAELRSRAAAKAKAPVALGGGSLGGGWSGTSVGILVCALLGAVGIGVVAARSQTNV